MSKARPLATNSQVVNAKEMFLKKIKNAIPVNTQMLSVQKQTYADLQEVLVVWVEDQTSHNISLSQSLIWSKALTLVSYLKSVRGEEEAEENLKASRGWFMRFKEKGYLSNIKVQGEAASPGAEATASYPVDLAKTG